MHTRWLTAIVTRELRTLARELEAYPDDRLIWGTPSGLTNSAGTLCLHLCGNLNHFLGAVLGSTGYVRDRDREFGARDVPRATLLAQVAETIGMVEKVLPAVSDTRLADPFPAPPGGYRVSTGDFLFHLATHLAYHVGQVDYHRRVVTASPTSVGPQAIGELASAAKG